MARVWAGVRLRRGYGATGEAQKQLGCAADALRYLVATKARTIIQRKLRGL
jgi:hypothetical protein